MTVNEESTTIWGLMMDEFGCRRPDGKGGYEPCSTCCTGMAVSELSKDILEPCQHLADNRCSIYPQRPISCRNQNCSNQPKHQQLYLLTVAKTMDGLLLQLLKIAE